MKTIAFVLVLAGCGDNLSVPVDAGRDVPRGFHTAPHTPLPEMDPHSGSVLAHVKLVTITYSNYASASTVEAFGDDVVASTWFTTVGAEYGIGAGTHEAKIHLGTAPTTTLEDTAVEAQILTLLTNNQMPRPSASGNQYLYMLYVPPSVPLGNSLQGFYGYHSQLTYNGTDFPYALILDDGSGIDTTTSTAAHELFEAASDPLFVTNPDGDGYWVDKAVPDPWYLLLGEGADLCDGENLIMSGSYAVQRVWSNAAAAADKSPCVPYDPDDTWTSVSADPETMPTIPKGGTATFTLTGWSTEELPDWALSTDTADYSDLTKSQMAPSLSTPVINNGKTVTLTLHAPANASSGALGGVYVYSGDNYRPWPVGFVVQ